MKSRDEQLQECIKFHGHFCPGLAVGFRAAQELMRRLNVTKAGDEELFAIVETDACGADAIQVMTGCTFGKGNLFFNDYGRHAFTLGSRQRNMAFRASLKGDSHMFSDDFVGPLEKALSGTATPEERGAFLKIREIRGQEILDITIENLFNINSVAIEFPPRARVVRSEVCPGCNEPVRIDYLESSGGAGVCPSCRKQASSGQVI